MKYAGSFRIFVAFLMRQRISKLHQITGSHFDTWREQRRATRAPKTVYTESVVVKQLLRWAKSRKLMADDPLAGIKLAKPVSEPKDGPSFEQLNTLLAAADAELAVWLLVLALTGMRVGELQRLRSEDVDFGANWIHIRSRPGAETKTRASRKVPMHPRLRAVLEARPPHSHAWFFTAAPSRKYPGGGNWISPKRVNDRFLRLLKRLGLPAGRASGFVIHSLRHFFETYAVNARTPQLAIDIWLGHHSNQSMAAVYYNFHDVDSQKFMREIPFELSVSGAEARPVGKSGSRV